MNLSLPPALFYAIGAMLVTFGSLRAYHLGWQALRRLRGEIEEDDGEGGDIEDEGESDSEVAGRVRVVEAVDERRRTRARRHVRFGLLWVAMGLFLVISTVIQTVRAR